MDDFSIENLVFIEFHGNKILRGGPLKNQAVGSTGQILF